MSISGIGWSTGGSTWAKKERHGWGENTDRNNSGLWHQTLKCRCWKTGHMYTAHTRQSFFLFTSSVCVFSWFLSTSVKPSFPISEVMSCFRCRSEKPLFSPRAHEGQWALMNKVGVPLQSHCAPSENSSVYTGSLVILIELSRIYYFSSSDCNLAAQTLTSFKSWLWTTCSIVTLSPSSPSFHRAVGSCSRAAVNFSPYLVVEIAGGETTWLFFLIVKLKSVKENRLSREIYPNILTKSHFKMPPANVFKCLSKNYLILRAPLWQ